MTPEIQVLLSGALTFGVPLALAVRELVIARRGSGDGLPPDRNPDPLPGPRKPLPDCLIPKPPPRDREIERERVLELV